LFSVHLKRGWALRPKLDLPPLMNRLVPSNLKFVLELEPYNTDFLLYKGVEPLKGEYKLEIIDMHLNVCFVVLRQNPKPHNIQIPYVNYDMVTYTAKSGSFESASGPIQLKTFPSRVLAFFVKSKAYHGDLDTNPFILDNPKLENITAVVDGRPYSFESASYNKISVDCFYNLARDCYMARHGELGKACFSRYMMFMGYMVCELNTSKSGMTDWVGMADTPAPKTPCIAAVTTK
jgi:hypothetical protein